MNKMRLWEELETETIITASDKKSAVDMGCLAWCNCGGELSFGDYDDEEIGEALENIKIKPYDPRKSDQLFCTDCGQRSLRVIENTEPDGCGKYKQVCTCDNECCQQIVYIVRHK